MPESASPEQPQPRGDTTSEITTNAVRGIGPNGQDVPTKELTGATAGMLAAAKELTGKDPVAAAVKKPE